MHDDKEYLDELEKTGHFNFGDLGKSLEDTDQFLFSDLEKRINRNDNYRRNNRFERTGRIESLGKSTRSSKRVSGPIKEAKKEYENKLNQHENKKGNKKKGSAKKIVLGICVTVLILCIAAGGFLFAFLNGFSGEDIPTATKPVTGIVNILLIGKDIGTLEDTENDQLKRTDTIILANINTDTDEVTMVSIPRDTLVQDEQGYDCKINSLYQLGTQVLQDEVEELLRVDINYVVEVDYKAFREFIDAIGGVTVTPKFDMNYDDFSQGLSIHFNGGETVNLDGEQAEGYFRWRQNDDGSNSEMGDIGRIENQQEFMGEIFKKCASPAIVTKIPDIVKIMQDNVSTNMSGKNILQYATEVAGYSIDKIKMYTLGGEFYDVIDDYGKKISYWRVIDEMNSEIYAKLDPNFDEATFAKESESIMILNGTEIPGLATTMQQDLINKGYKNVKIGNTLGSIDVSTVECEDSKVLDLVSKDVGIEEKVQGLTPGYECSVLITIGFDHELAKGNSGEEETQY